MPLPTLSDITKLTKTALTIEAQEKIMELRQGAMELQEDNLALRIRVQELEAKLRENVEPVFPRCPACGLRSFAVVRSQPDPIFGEGVTLRTLECQKCKYSEQRQSTGKGD